MDHSNPIRFIALDRDGTVIENKHYLSDPEGVEFTSQSIDGLKRLTSLGLPLVLITNQSGIGRGYFTEDQMQAVHERLSALLEKAGIRLAGIHFCPHTPDDKCDCRKPATAMLEEAAAALSLPVKSAVVIGDNVCDIELGQAAGCRTILVRTGHGEAVLQEDAVEADAVAADLLDAAGQIESWLEQEHA